jgi:hypothetical protein
MDGSCEYSSGGYRECDAEDEREKDPVDENDGVSFV